MKKGDECDKEKRELGNNVVCIENVLIVSGSYRYYLEFEIKYKDFSISLVILH